MKVLQDAIFDRLAGSATITAGIGTFQGVPAIFTRFPIPGGAPARRITISSSISDDPWDTKTSTGREVITDITVWTEESGDPSLVESLAEEVRALFHREPVDVTGYGNFIAVVGGPIENDDDQMYGRVISMRHVLVKA